MGLPTRIPSTVAWAFFSAHFTDLFSVRRAECTVVKTAIETESEGFDPERQLD